MLTMGCYIVVYTRMIRDTMPEKKHVAEDEINEFIHPRRTDIKGLKKALRKCGKEWESGKISTRRDESSQSQQRIRWRTLNKRNRVSRLLGRSGCGSGLIRGENGPPGCQGRFVGGHCFCCDLA